MALHGREYTQALAHTGEADIALQRLASNADCDAETLITAAAILKDNWYELGYAHPEQYFVGTCPGVDWITDLTPFHQYYIGIGLDNLRMRLSALDYGGEEIWPDEPYLFAEALWEVNMGMAALARSLNSPQEEEYIHRAYIAAADADVIYNQSH